MWNLFKKKNTGDDEHRSLQLISKKGMPFAYVEAYKSLRTNLSFLNGSTGVKAITLTSTVPQESKSNVAVNLALTLVDSGKKVALVDCDLRKPVLHRYLKSGHNVKGVSNVLSNQCKLEDAMLYLDEHKLSFLPAGTPPPNPSEMLSQPKMKELVEELKANYDYVIFDAPPVSIVTDAAILGSITDGVLFVVRSQYGPAEATKAAVKKLQDMEVKVLGAVLTRYDVSKSVKSSSYSYSYFYQYSGSYGTPPEKEKTDK